VAIADFDFIPEADDFPDCKRSEKIARLQGKRPAQFGSVDPQQADCKPGPAAERIAVNRLSNQYALRRKSRAARCSAFQIRPARASYECRKHKQRDDPRKSCAAAGRGRRLHLLPANSASSSSKRWRVCGSTFCRASSRTCLASSILEEAARVRAFCSASEAILSMARTH